MQGIPPSGRGRALSGNWHRLSRPSKVLRKCPAHPHLYRQILAEQETLLPVQVQVLFTDLYQTLV